MGKIMVNGWLRAGALALSVLSIPCVASALELPTRTHALTRPARASGATVPAPRLFYPNGMGIHQLFGTVRRIDGPAIFLLVTRFNRPVLVDASIALRSGAFSAPLFVGKPVLVEGNWSAQTFVAGRMTRMTRIDASLGPDR